MKDSNLVGIVTLWCYSRYNVFISLYPATYILDEIDWYDWGKESLPEKLLENENLEGGSILMNYFQQLKGIMDCAQVRKDLELVRELNLPESCIAAGYVRNRVWDVLHGYENETPLNDIDVIYYDPTDLSEEKDRLLSLTLNMTDKKEGWSVKNQARMHLRNQVAPYESTRDAMSCWPETATAVGLYLDRLDDIEVISPYGLDDLFQLKIRQSPRYMDTAYFMQRVNEKQWLTRWPNLTLFE